MDDAVFNNQTNPEGIPPEPGDAAALTSSGDLNETEGVLSPWAAGDDPVLRETVGDASDGIPEEGFDITEADVDAVLFPEPDGGDAAEGAGKPHVSWWERELFDWMQTIVTSLILVSLVFAFAARIIGVLGQSMEGTLFTGQKVLISDLFYTPQYGDIVVFNMKDIHKRVPLGVGEEDEPLIKRVIATEGQTVDIDYAAGEVRVDGVLLDEPYIKEITRTPTVPGDTTYHCVVSEGMVFVMGDNRNHSSDSRMIGPVDRRYILGRVLLRVWPLQEFGTVDHGGTSS